MATAAETEAAPPDALQTHKGPHAKAGALFTLSGEPVAIDGAGVLVALLKTEWTTLEDAQGKEVREATAIISVVRGHDQQRLRIDAGQTRTALGVAVTVVEAGERYVKARGTWQAEVKLKVSPAP